MFIMWFILNAEANKVTQIYIRDYSTIMPTGWPEQAESVSRDYIFACLQCARAHVQHAATPIHEPAVRQIALALKRKGGNGPVRLPFSPRPVAYHSATSAVVTVQKKHSGPQTVVTPDDNDNISNCHMPFPATRESIMCTE